jgi:hypothetical protein
LWDFDLAADALADGMSVVPESQVSAESFDHGANFRIGPVIQRLRPTETSWAFCKSSNGNPHGGSCLQQEIRKASSSVDLHPDLARLGLVTVVTTSFLQGRVALDT